jgi:hypothetical protein
MLMTPFTKMSAQTTMGCIVLLLAMPMCWAMPTILVDSGKARCVTVDGTQDEIIRVHYEAPGNCGCSFGYDNSTLPHCTFAYTHSLYLL